MNSRSWRSNLDGVFRSRRCLVPMNSFYEWQQRATAKVTHYIKLSDPKMFACAGLWNRSVLADGNEIESFTILTCEPTN